MQPNVETVDAFLRDLQDRICAALEKADGGARFVEDAWARPAGGGGRTRVLKNGTVFEQGGVNYSRVTGDKLPPSATAHRPQLAGRQGPGAKTHLVGPAMAAAAAITGHLADVRQLG